MVQTLGRLNDPLVKALAQIVNPSVETLIDVVKAPIGIVDTPVGIVKALPERGKPFDHALFQTLLPLQSHTPSGGG